MEACGKMSKLKYSAVMCVGGATLTIRRSGYAHENGSGYFMLDENDVEWKPHNERDGLYLKVKLARSEMINLRDFLNREFPQEFIKEQEQESKMTSDYAP